MYLARNPVYAAFHSCSRHKVMFFVVIFLAEQDIHSLWLSGTYFQIRLKSNQDKLIDGRLSDFDDIFIFF